MKRYAIAAVAVVALVGIGAFLIVPALFPTSGFQGSVDATFTDAAGNAVFLPAIYTGGVAVTGIMVTVKCTLSTLSGDTPEAISVSGTLKLEFYVQTATPYLAGHRNIALYERNIAEVTWLMGPYTLTDTLIVDDEGKEHGWILMVSASLSADAVVGEDDLQATWDGEQRFTLTWSADTLVLQGSVSGDMG